MNRLRAVLDGEPPAVAVSFENAGDVEAYSVASQAVAAGVDIAELRIDRFPDTGPPAVLDYAHSFRALPTIATIRLAGEGGSWKSSEQERLELFRAVLPAVDGVDVELSAADLATEVVRSASSAGKVSIVSYHNFDETPDPAQLEELLHRALGLGADYVKISVMAKTPSDVRALAQFLIANQPLPIIAIAMGALGAMSRIFFPALGSRMTFSFIGDAMAPGQVAYEETSYLLRKFYPGYKR
jgi:3-dehydroquinate dehydratase-1